MEHCFSARKPTPTQFTEQSSSEHAVLSWQNKRKRFWQLMVSEREFAAPRNRVSTWLYTALKCWPKWTAEISYSNPKTRQQSQIQKPLKHFTSFLDVSLPAHGAEVAQPGRALGWRPSRRRFKPCPRHHIIVWKTYVFALFSLLDAMPV